MPLHLAYALLANADSRQRAIDALPYPVFVKDADGRFVAVNGAFCRLMGGDSAALVGKTDHDFVPAEQADIFRAKDILVVKTGEPNANEEVLTDSAGQLRTIITRKHRVLMPGGGRFIVGCITDITELRRSEIQARRIGRRETLTAIHDRILFQRAFEEARAIALQAALWSLSGMRTPAPAAR